MELIFRLSRVYERILELCEEKLACSKGSGDIDMRGVRLDARSSGCILGGG